MNNNNDDDNGNNDNTRSSRSRNMQQRNRAVASREASRLARPDSGPSSKKLGHASRQKSAVSSTPFGFDTTFSQKKNSNKKQRGEGGEEEQDGQQQHEEWCGPFSVARQMIAARDEARRKREEEKQGNDQYQHPLDELVQQSELERKRKANPSMMWRSSIHGQEEEEQKAGKKTQNLYYKRQKRYEQQQKQKERSYQDNIVNLASNNMSGGGFPSLFNLCIAYLVQNFEHVEALGLPNGGDTTIRRAIVDSLVVAGKMNGAAFDTIVADAGMETLEIIDCSQVTGEQMVEALTSLFPDLKALILNNCGRCFNSKVVDVIVNFAKSSSSDLTSLFALSIGGAYLLQDKDAARLIDATATTLSSLEFKACPLLGMEFCKSIHTNFGTVGGGGGALLELTLEDLSSLTKEQLMTMFQSSTEVGGVSAFRHLKSISFKHIEALDDEVITALLLKQGNPISTLEGIHIDNNQHISDVTLSTIRQCNVDGKLKSLQLSGCPCLTTAGFKTFFTFFNDLTDMPDPPALRKLDLSNCGCGDVEVSAADDDNNEEENNDDSGKPGGAVTDEVVNLALSAANKVQDENNDDALLSDEEQKEGSSSFAPRPKETQPSRSAAPGSGIVSLDLSHSTAITDKTLENLATKCESSLKELKLSFCVHVSDKGLGYLVSQVKEQFNYLSIWGCAQITDEFLDGHARVPSDNDDKMENTGGGLVIEGAWMKQSGHRSVR